MPSLLPFTFGDAGFPSNFSGSLQDEVDAWTANLTATTTSASTLMLGQIGGSAPLSNIGPWLNGTVWYVWNSGSSTYVPTTLKIDDTTSLFNVVLATTTLTADRTASFPDQDGTIATLTDLYNPRDTTVLTYAATMTLDWSTTFTYYVSQTGNATFNHTNSLPGQELALVISTTGAAFTQTFNGTLFPGGTAPMQAVARVDLYVFKNIAGSIYLISHVTDLH